MLYQKDLTIEGSILDDDYIDGIEFSIDGEEIEYNKTFNAFSKTIDGLKSGDHTLVIKAIDNNGVLGDEQEINFQIESFKPEISINSIRYDDEETIFSAGHVLTNDEGYTILGTLNAGNDITSFMYNLDGGEYIELPFKSLGDGPTNTFVINVDESFHYGIVDISIKAVDSFGNEVIEKSQVYIKNYAVINDEWGLYYNKLPESGPIQLDEEKTFEIYFNGPNIKSVKTIPETEFFQVSFKSKVISTKWQKDGELEDLRFIVETEKGTYETEKFDFILDNEAPIIDLIVPTVYSAQSTILTLQGLVTELKLDSLDYRFSNQKEFSKISFLDTTDEQNFSTTVDIPETVSETLSIELKATDTFGRISNVIRSFTVEENKFQQILTNELISTNTGKSSDKPVVFINFPYNKQITFTEPLLSGFARDDDAVKEIRIKDSIEGGKSITVNTDGLFDLSLLDFGTGYKSINIVAIDVNGVESKVQRISYTYEPQKASIKVDHRIGDLIPKEFGAIYTGEVQSDLFGELYYRFGNDEYKKTNLTDRKFSIILPSSLKWGRNNIDLQFRDSYSRLTEKSSYFYTVDHSSLSTIVDDEGIYFYDIRLNDDLIDLSEKTDLIGFYNGRDIKTVSLESESGKVPDFLTVFSRDHEIILKSVKDGISKNVRVVVETIDGDIFWSDYFSFISDDTKPILEIDTENNIFIQNSFPLIGKIKDDVKVSSLSYSLNRGTTWNGMEFKVPPTPVSKERYTKTSVLDYKVVDKGEPKEFIFDLDVDFSNMLDSGYTIWVKVEDIRGNKVIEKLSFIKDNTNPNLELFIPGIDEVNGIISLIGKSNDNIEMENITYSLDGIKFENAGIKDVFEFKIDFGADETFPETFVVKSTDKAGNFSTIYPLFTINQEKDKPVVEIQTPIDGEIIRNDFVISGMAFDDDRVATIFYSLDGGELLPVATDENNFSINIPLDTITNNDHVITVKAVDVLGIESDIVTSTFWVSKEEPTSTLILPKIEDTKRGTIKLVGTSFDKNGIDSVYVSTDNGVSYQKAIGQEDWNYTFNTTNIKDGTYSLFVKAIDKLQTTGFFSTLINIDNTPPELIINKPVDGDILSDTIEFSGRSLDNVGLKDVRYKIYNHSAEAKDGVMFAEGILESKGIFNIKIPLDGYDIGDYNIELIAHDEADNRTISTRNFSVTQSDNAGDLEMLFPQPGSILTSEFEVSGKVLGKKTLDFVECYIDNRLYSEIKVNEFNFFNLKINTLQLSEGAHTIGLKGTLSDGQVYDTPTYDFYVENSGEWLNIVNMQTGDNISGRPYITGESGYIYTDDIKDLEEIPLEERIIPTLIEVSLDNGQIFAQAKGTVEWSFRIETWQYEDGLTPILVRANYSNGETKTSRLVVNIDRSEPEVAVLEDIEQGHFNESIKLSGIASDANGLTDISVILRDGDKSDYEIPGLFQGMFIDTEVSYGKVYGLGIGLTFFDDNVKLQGTIGETRADSDDARIKGFYYGFKLLANLYSLNLSSLFGPDLEPYSMSLAIGASFTNKTLTVSDVDSTMWFSAVLCQFEFFKMSFENDYLSSVSLFLDLESTLISSENDGGFYSRIGIGSRITLF